MIMLTRVKLFLTVNKRAIATFLSVGAFSALVNFSAFAFFWGIFNLPYKMAVSIAYVLSVICHFTGNRHLTFKSGGVGILNQIVKYLIMVLTNYLITIFVVRFVVDNLHLSPYIGIVCAIGTTVWVGFLVSKFWVFQKKPT